MFNLNISRYSKTKMAGNFQSVSYSAFLICGKHQILQVFRFTSPDLYQCKNECFISKLVHLIHLNTVVHGKKAKYHRNFNIFNLIII